MIVDLVDADQERRDLGVDAAHLAHRIIVEAKLEALSITLDLEFVDVAAELDLLIESLPWEQAL